MKHAQGVKAKRLKKNKKNTLKKIIILILVLILVLVAIFVSNLTKKTEDVVNNVYNEINTPPVDEQLTEQTLQSIVENVDVSDMPDSIQGYSVIGKIVIDKLGIQKYILGKTTNESLNLGVTKFWGPHINDQGNFCISGHDYKNTFGRLKELVIGDTFYLVGKDGRKITYQINTIIPAKNPYDMSHIQQNSDGTRKVTLITCDQGRPLKICCSSRRKKGTC